MTTKSRLLQHGRPFWIESLANAGSGQLMEPVKLSSGKDAIGDDYNETWLQTMLHRFPQCLPVSELEPVLDRLIPVGREVPTPAGYIDNLFVTADGNIVLVECKLWRNPEARRKVIAQIIDYAQSLSHWKYKDLDQAVKKSLDANGQIVGKPLFDLLETEDVDESAFIDAIQKNLRIGRMLLLVVGDGIREDTEGLADYLQMHAGFHFTLGLIQLAIFKAPGGGFVVQPRVLARTLNIERTVVRIANDTIMAESSSVSPVPGSTPPAMSLTAEMFWEKLEVAEAAAAKALRLLLQRADELGLNIFLSPAAKSASLKWESPGGQSFTLGSISTTGTLTTFSVSWGPNHIGMVELGHAYLEELASLVGGAVKKTKDPGMWYVVTKADGTKTPAALALLDRQEQWLALIQRYQSQLTRAMSSES